MKQTVPITQRCCFSPTQGAVRVTLGTREEAGNSRGTVAFLLFLLREREREKLKIFDLLFTHRSWLLPIKDKHMEFFSDHKAQVTEVLPLRCASIPQWLQDSSSAVALRGVFITEFKQIKWHLQLGWWGYFAPSWRTRSNATESAPLASWLERAPWSDKAHPIGIRKSCKVNYNYSTWQLHTLPSFPTQNFVAVCK